MGLLHPDVEVRASPIDGYGLFALAPIRRGEQVTLESPDQWVVMSDAEFDAFVATVDSYDAVALGGGRHRVSTAPRSESPDQYVNHSCDPNARFDGAGLVALRDIASGHEITTDYAVISRRAWSMECRCGAPGCRGIVRGLV